MIQTTVNPSLKQLEARLAKAKMGLLEDPTPWKKVAIFLDGWVQRNFATEGGKVGGWVPFSEFSHRKLLDPSAQLLRDTGRLRASFVPFSSRMNAGIGSELDYAEQHDQGIGVPQRRILPKRAEVYNDAMDIIDDHVKLVVEETNK